MATQRKVAGSAALTLEGLIEKYGILGLIASRNAQAWEVVGGGIRFVPELSAAAKKQLQGELDAVYGALLKNAQAGDALSGAVAVQVAMGKAALN